MKRMLVAVALCAMSLCGGLYAQQQGDVTANDVVTEQKEDVKITRGERVEVVSSGDKVLGMYPLDINTATRTETIAIIGFFATVLLVVFFTMLFLYLNRRRRLKVTEAAILHGQELPQAFFDEGKPKRSFLQRGITQIAVGAAFTVAIGVMVDWDIAVWGLVVVALGVGNVLAHFLGDKEKKTDGQ